VRRESTKRYNSALFSEHWQADDGLARRIASESVWRHVIKIFAERSFKFAQACIS
tara:strand:+ start:211 stop:375 length:165 start_codon:yes stop_codon:yes gene_type:complete